MAELIAAGTALGIASSLITFADAAWRVLKRLDEYSDRTKAVPKIIKHIRPQLRVLAEKMEELKQAAKDGSLATSSQNALSKAVETYEEQINLLDHLTTRMLPEKGDSTRTRAKKAMLSIHYEKELAKIWAELETYKTTFIFHFTNMKSDHALDFEVKPLKTHYHYPALITSHFVIRERPLQDIEDAMAGHEIAATPRVVVLLGMGGCGKTQLALQFCQQSEAKKRFTSILWVDASSPAATSQSFVTIAGFITNSEINLKDDEAVLEIVKSRLCMWTDSWLIVFDNFDDPSAFKSRDIKEYFPRGENGAILFTSRHGDVKRLGNTVTVAEMSESEGLELLFRQTGCERSEKNSRIGIEIITRLGNLALAIDQAGAYISARSLPLDLFIDHYNNRREKVLKETPSTLWEYRRKLSTAEVETSLSFFTTWEMSFEQIGGKTEEHLLILSAFFDNADIFEDLFKAQFELEKPEWMKLFDIEGNWDSYEFQDVLARLAKISLIRSFEITTSGARFSLHPLVQEWIKLRSNTQDRQSKTREAIEVLADFMNGQDVGTFTLQLNQTILSHLNALIQNDAMFLDHNNGLESESHLYAANCFASYYDSQGQYEKAEALYDRALAEKERTLGRNHVSTLRTVNNLANLCSKQGRLAEAEDMYDRALAGREKALGRNHVSTLGTVNNLANFYSDQGRLVEAEDMYDRVLAGRENILGHDHKSTLDSVYNLGSLYWEQGNTAKAMTQFERAAQGYEKTLGSNHPETIDAQDQLEGLMNEPSS
jgi:tetratricopeptide (TPR) repeat protein